MNKKTKTVLIVVAVLAVVYMAGKYFTDNEATAEEKYDNYINQALEYKSKGDQGDQNYYKKAIQAYENAAEISSTWLPYLNIGNIYKMMGEYTNAEISYDKGLTLAPDSTLYTAKIDLYENYMKKPPKEVKVLYEDALSKVTDNHNIYLNYAAFLKNTGEYQAALTIYELLLENFPNNQGYKLEIAELKLKI